MEARPAYLGFKSDYYTHCHDLPPQLGGARSWPFHFHARCQPGVISMICIDIAACPALCECLLCGESVVSASTN